MNLDRESSHRDHGFDVRFLVGAGDGNRTRTISLGIRQIRAPDHPDLEIRWTASDRDGPCDTGVNGPPMAAATRLPTSADLIAHEL